MKPTTKEFENRIKNATTVAQLNKILKDIPEISFPVRIDQLREKCGMSFSQIQTKSGITKSLFYAIVNGTRSPRKAHIIKMGLAMDLSIDAMNELLKLAKLKELYAKNKEDAIIIFGIKNKLQVAQIEELLIDAGAELHLLDE